MTQNAELPQGENIQFYSADEVELKYIYHKNFDLNFGQSCAIVCLHCNKILPEKKSTEFYSAFGNEDLRDKRNSAQLQLVKPAISLDSYTSFEVIADTQLPRIIIVYQKHTLKSC